MLDALAQNIMVSHRARIPGKYLPEQAPPRAGDQAGRHVPGIGRAHHHHCEGTDVQYQSDKEAVGSGVRWRGGGEGGHGISECASVYTGGEG